MARAFIKLSVCRIAVYPPFGAEFRRLLFLHLLILCSQIPDPLFPHPSPRILHLFTFSLPNPIFLCSMFHVLYPLKRLTWMVCMYNILSHNMLDGLLASNIDRSPQNMENALRTPFCRSILLQVRTTRPMTDGE